MTDPAALSALPTAAVVGLLCVAVIVEIVALPGVVLPGATVTLLAGALIGAGRPWAAVAVPVALAVAGADQLAYVTGALVADWWRRRRRHPDQGGAGRGGAAGSWLAAAVPSLAAAAGLGYRSFAVRVVLLRLPWLAAALTGGALAAGSLARVGHVLGVAGLVASGLVLAALLAARHLRPRRRGRADGCRRT